MLAEDVTNSHFLEQHCYIYGIDKPLQERYKDGVAFRDSATSDAATAGDLTESRNAGAGGASPSRKL